MHKSDFCKDKMEPKISDQVENIRERFVGVQYSSPNTVSNRNAMPWRHVALYLPFSLTQGRVYTEKRKIS